MFLFYGRIIMLFIATFLEMWRMFVDKPLEGELKGLSNAHCIRVDFDRKNPSQHSSHQETATTCKAL